MFVRETRRRNRDGSHVAYLQLVQSVRDPLTGRPRARVLHGLGRVGAVDRAAAAGLAAALGGSADPVRAAGQPDVTVAGRLPYGSIWLLDQLWRRIGLDRALGGGPTERVAFALTAQQALAPGSKLAAARWVRTGVAVPGCDGFTAGASYAAMDLLRARAGAVDAAVLGFAASFGPDPAPRYDLVLLDLGSRSPDLEPVPAADPATVLIPHEVVAVPVTLGGLPLRVRLHPRTTGESAVIAAARADLPGWRLHRVIRLGHDGMHTVCESAWLPGPGGAPIRVRKLRGAAGPGPVTGTFTDLDQADRDAAARTARLAELRRAQAAGPAAVDRLLATWPALRRLAPGGMVDPAAVARDARADGVYLLDGPGPVALHAARCERLAGKVASWRRVAGVFDFGPVHHWRQDRVEAHVRLVQLAVLLVRALEIATDDRWPTLRAALDPLRLHTLRTPYGRIRLTDELTPGQRTVLRTAGAADPPRIVDVVLGNFSAGGVLPAGDDIGT